MLFAIETNKVVVIVEALNKAAANAYGAARVDMEVRSPSLADLAGVTDLSTIPVVLKGGKTQAELDTEAQAKLAKAAKKAAPALV